MWIIGSILSIIHNEKLAHDVSNTDHESNNIINQCEKCHFPNFHHTILLWGVWVYNILCKQQARISLILKSAWI